MILATPQETLTLIPGVNLRTGLGDFHSAFGEATSLEEDVLRLASAVYCADLAFRRGERERYVRDISLRVPVANLRVFDACRVKIEHVLYKLSDDNWSVEFSRADGVPEAAPPVGSGDRVPLLFSGGLDSLAGAVDLLEHGGRLCLVSHVTGNRVVREAQEQLANHLETHYPSKVSRIPFWVGGRKHAQAFFPKDRDREDSQRTRTFLFLSIAGLVARRLGSRTIVMAENGIMAVHLPLVSSRVSPFSTKTAHPEFLRYMADLLSDILAFPVVVENPYLYCTKGEVVAPLVPEHLSAVWASMSCWRAGRGLGDLHCGECVPCLVRRIALETNTTSPTGFSKDLFGSNLCELDESDTGKRNLADLLQLVLTFLEESSELRLCETYPELISTHFDTGRMIGVYRRFASEAMEVLGSYPEVRRFIGDSQALANR